MNYLVIPFLVLFIAFTEANSSCDNTYIIPNPVNLEKLKFSKLKQRATVEINNEAVREDRIEGLISPEDRVRFQKDVNGICLYIESKELGNLNEEIGYVLEEYKINYSQLFKLARCKIALLNVDVDILVFAIFHDFQRYIRLLLSSRLNLPLVDENLQFESLNWITERLNREGGASTIEIERYTPYLSILRDYLNSVRSSRSNQTSQATF